ncbi:hypothetical protein [Abyssalbus ytuae]|uniref:Uncharacterized protein n=1 Tax=Abyssalbus ytuae TaxID=2926907 RepID=A0A9E6ZJ89_9FLAO|nr:hypothetical protein [Abyssalbus ytuae]UOB16577.1 hypothetical protein MQE35_12630 [Abyssalbus ytuae]
MNKIISSIFWFFYKLTKKGRQEYILREGFKRLNERKLEKIATKMNIISSSNKFLKQKKILAFNSGMSISKSKKSNHQVIENAKNKHGEELKKRGLTLTKKGKFQNA